MSRRHFQSRSFKVNRSKPARVRDARMPETPGVYAFRWGDHVKVGYSSTSIRRRLQAVRDALPPGVGFLYCAWPDASLAFEQHLHATLSAERIKGEWFRWSDTVRATLDQSVPF
jgi:hypothetical protein